MKKSKHIYPSLDEREIAQDRLIINEKIRRHFNPKTTQEEEEEEEGHFLNHKSKLENDDVDDDDMEMIMGVGSGSGGKGMSSLSSQHLQNNNDEDNDEDIQELFETMQHFLSEGNNNNTITGGTGVGTGNNISTSSVEGGYYSQQQRHIANRTTSIDPNHAAGGGKNYGIHPHNNPSSFSSRGQESLSSQLSPPTSFTFGLPLTTFDIPKTQQMKKQIIGITYIFLSFGILLSYFFFLESCKLVNYGK